MREWVSIFLALAILSVFSFGCTAIDKQTKVKCPKCGAVFSVEEAMQERQKTGY
jgi:hypothetical protein